MIQDFAYGAVQQFQRAGQPLAWFVNWSVGTAAGPVALTGGTWTVLDRPTVWTVAAPPAPAGTVLLSDTFTDATGTLLQNHTPDVGPAWTKVAGTPQVNANQAVGGSAGDNLVVADAGAADVVQTLDMIFAASDSSRLYLVGRYSDSSNYWQVYNLAGTWRISKVVAGAETVLATATQALV